PRFSLWLKPAGSSLPQSAFQRMGPGVVQLGDGRVDHRAPLIFDAKSIAADDLSNLARRHSILSRTLENAGKETWRDGDNGAGPAFAKEGILGREWLFKFDVCAKLGRSMLRPYDRGEAGFG